MHCADPHEHRIHTHPHTQTHARRMHACALFKVRAQGENVKWPSWGHQIFSYPSLSANHLPWNLELCVHACVHVQEGGWGTYIGGDDETTEATWLYCSTQGVRHTDRQIHRVCVWAPAVVPQQTDRWSFGGCSDRSSFPPCVSSFLSLSSRCIQVTPRPGRS